MEASAYSRNMRCGQLLACQVRDAAVLEAMAAVPRDRYVPVPFQGIAYVDEEIPLAEGRYLMEPLAFARLLEFAAVGPGDKVLDVGCGLGYSAAVLGRLCHKVIAVESHPDLVSEARKRLDRQLSVEVVTAPLDTGCARQQPYGVIVLEGAVREIPSALLSQLAEGGRLVAVENKMVRPGTCTGLGKALKIVRRGGHFDCQWGGDLSVPLLPGFAAEGGFVFERRSRPRPWTPLAM